MGDRTDYTTTTKRGTERAGVSAEAGAEEAVEKAKGTEKVTGFTAAKAGATGPAPPKFDLTTAEGREGLRKWREDQRAGRAAAVGGKVAAATK